MRVTAPRHNTGSRAHVAVGPSAHIKSCRSLAAVVLAAGAMEATFVPELGMLGLSLRHDGEELLALPHGVGGYRAGHQTGLALLAPWANRLGGRQYEIAGTAVDLAGLSLGTDDNGLPIHGTMTAQAGWEIMSLEPGTVRARFSYGARSDLLVPFPFPHDLIVEAALDGIGLTVSTTLRPTGPRSVPVAFGWHPYLHLPRTPRRSWRLVLPSCQHLELDDRGLPTGRSTPQPGESRRLDHRSFDDLYALHDDDHVLAVEDHRRRLSVHFDAGYPYAQVFAPLGSGFVCLEPMTAATNALLRGDCPLVAAGDEFTAQFSITAERAHRSGRDG